MLQELYKKKRPGAIIDALNKAPKGLHETLRHVLESFSSTLQDEDPDDLNDLLAWVTCSERPLKLGELDKILRLKSLTGDGMISLENSLRIQFAAFFSLNRKDDLTTADLQRLSDKFVDIDFDAATDVDVHGLDEELLDDVNNITDFSSNPMTTEVTFCHASIGDFFRDEAGALISASQDYPLVGIDINEAKASTLQTCLELLTHKEIRDKDKGGMSMISYASLNWEKHLKIVDQSKTNRLRKRAIGKSLVKMFQDDELLQLWVPKSISWYFLREDTPYYVRSWLDDPEAISGLSTEEEAWVQETAQNPLLTFTLVAHAWPNTGSKA
jgi:hypothetical protein